MVTAPQIPGHRVAGIVGQGGFATVYRCWQLAVGREVAVKVDNRVLLGERDRRRFVREVTAAGRLSGHPHVIDVYDAGTLADGRPYLVMELCPAGSLNDALRRRGPMSAAQVRDIGVRICDALAAAHAAGVLHRDIKPANILVNRYGLVGLSDFGLASIMAVEGEQSTTREALTPAYASPETFRCEEPTVAADVYSLAATLYALLAGRPPRFPAGPGSPGIATIIALQDKPVGEVPGVPPGLMAILRRGLAADPAVRPPSAAALRDALAALPPLPAQAGRPPLAARQPGPGMQPAAAPPAYAGRPGAPATVSARAPASAQVPASARVPISAQVRPGAHQARGGGAYGPGPGGGPATAPGGARRRRPATMLAAAAAVVVLIGAAAVAGARVLAHGDSGDSGGSGAPTASPGVRPAAVTAPGVFGIPTVASGCPAASVQAAARCPRDPECWNGLVVISGSVTARSLPCTSPHVWETFAIAILPADVRTFDQSIVAKDPAVTAVCSMRVLLASRRAAAREIPPGSWAIEVMPPDEASFGSGARAYRCVAHSVSGPDPSTSQFGPQAGQDGRTPHGRGGPGSGKNG
jgi:Protein kinase domain